MVKNTTIILRIAAETKQRLTEAAQRKGLTLSTFILEATEKAAKETERHNITKQFQGVPTSFRASCFEAQRGGYGGYKNAGALLARHLAAAPPYALDAQEWQDQLDELQELLQARTRDDEKILAWFILHYPRCMELVPRRRHHQFLQGVYDAFEDERINFEV